MSDTAIGYCPSPHHRREDTMLSTPPAGLFAAALRNANPTNPARQPLDVLPAKEADATRYALIRGCIDPDTMTLTEQGRRVLNILGG
jgi:hypothetical protein